RALFHFLRTRKAVFRPRHCLQALLLQLLLAIGAGAVLVVADALQGLVNHIQDGAVGIGLTEEEFLGIGVGSLIGEVDGGVVVGLAALFFGAHNCLHQLVAPRQ